MLLTSCPPEADSSEKDGTPGGIRTRDLPLRRRLLYPTELQAHMEQVMGIEPTSPAWKAGALAVVLHPRQVPILSALRYYHMEIFLSSVLHGFPDFLRRMNDAYWYRYWKCIVRPCGIGWRKITDFTKKRKEQTEVLCKRFINLGKYGMI